MTRSELSILLYLSLFNQLDANGNAMPGTTCLGPTGNPIAAPCTILA